MSSLNLMLVDDEERFLATTAKLLERKGHRVVTASSGPEALDKLAEQDVEVVILDVKMPGMDGLEVLREIRLRFPLVGVIMLTGHGTIEYAVEGMKTGAFHCYEDLIKTDGQAGPLQSLSNRRGQAHKGEIDRTETCLLHQLQELSIQGSQ